MPQKSTGVAVWLENDRFRSFCRCLAARLPAYRVRAKCGTMSRIESWFDS
jgi:hypothetical protein